MSSLLKNILFALALAVILWLGYKIFFVADDEASSALDAEVITEASQNTQAFLHTLQQLREIKLNGQLFDDARFQTLVDYRQAIVDEPVGRPNPFAPIGQ
jgi:hypothetical protein